MDTIEQRVKKIIADHLGQDATQLANAANIIDDLGADSLDTLEISIELEDEFSIDISDEDFRTLTTVQQTVDYITKRVNEE